ncbi:MAG: GIY-YIG nuclease family protein [Candidatus Marinimicrobia bacterium]|nr:GIY-YIG nuclease family protein [Candidatus Neomarinimicrobiota bacterium]
MAHFVYILKSKQNNWNYVGMTDNVKKIRLHNNGHVKSTKPYAPFDLIFVEEFPTRELARFREKYYKTGFGKKVWMKKVRDGLKIYLNFQVAWGP